MAEKDRNEFVVDASFMLACLIPDEMVDSVKEVFANFKAGNYIFRSSMLFPFEVLNGIKLALTRKRISDAVANQLASYFIIFLEGIKLETLDLEKCWKLAQDEKMTIYDASYLALAKTNNLPLFSLDKHLQKFATSF